MERIFKIRCSQLGKIMGHIGLTPTQQKEYDELFTRKFDPTAKPLTAIMEKKLLELKRKIDNPELPDTCKTYLHEWFANEDRSVHSKYTDKGNMVELEAIQFMSEVLELGPIQKNNVQYENDYMTGSMDVDDEFTDTIYDEKAPWDKISFQSNVISFDKDYEWQGLGYCILRKRHNFILFYALMDTDESVNFGEEVIYSRLPDKERWIAYKWQYTDTQLSDAYEQIKDRVLLCRQYLKQYAKLVNERIGKVTLLN